MSKGISRRRWLLRVALCYLILTGLYAVCFPAVYYSMKQFDFRTLGKDISGMDLAGFDEEDESILQTYISENFRIYITDSEFHQIYATNLQPEGQIRRYIVEQADSYSTDAKIQHLKRRGARVMYQNLLVSQKGKMYYVCIRCNVQHIAETMQLTVLFMVLGGILLLGFVDWLLRNGRIVTETLARETEAHDVAQKEFLANVVHELKTPLAVISSQVELIEEGGKQVDHTYYCESIREEIAKLSELVSQMLDLNTIESRIETMKKEKISLSETAEYMALRYQSLMQQRGVHFARDLEDKCFVLGNREFLEQAINNYLMNAFQNTQRGASIRMTLKEHRGVVRLSVFNEGAPIRTEDLNHIWDRYRSTGSDGMTMSGMKNAGLGLHIVKSIIQKHDGSFGAENMDRGVMFWFELPLYRHR